MTADLLGELTASDPLQLHFSLVELRADGNFKDLLSSTSSGEIAAEKLRSEATEVPVKSVDDLKTALDFGLKKKILAQTNYHVNPAGSGLIACVRIMSENSVNTNS